MKLPKIIGISGTFSSGKDTLAEYLIENYNYNHVSTGDMVRKEAKKRYGNIERPTLRIVATELKKEGGASVLVKKALDEPKPIIISGIRAIGEAKTIKEAGGVLLFIDAYIKIRYERMVKRARDTEAVSTLEEFMNSELKELAVGNKDEDYNQITVQNMSDKTINNSGNLEDFYNISLDFLSKEAK